MYREDKSSELAQKCAEYIEDRSYGSIATSVANADDGNIIVANLDGEEFEIVALVYDELAALRLHCELTLTIASPEYELTDYAERLCGYTFVDDIWYECETDDDTGAYLIRIFIDNYSPREPDEIASLAAVNFIPVMEFAIS